MEKLFKINWGIPDLITRVVLVIMAILLYLTDQIFLFIVIGNVGFIYATVRNFILVFIRR